MTIHKKQIGFTLIETIIAICLIVFVLMAAFVFIFRLYRAQNYTLAQASAINSARKGIETMVKEIRQAQTGDDGSYIIELADDFEFIFYGDIDKDDAVERIRYFLENSNFKKGVVEPTDQPIEYPLENETISFLSKNVLNGSEPVFTYFNQDYPFDLENNPLDTPVRLKETKLMHVYLRINVDPNRPPLDFELESDVQIRNLKKNL